MNYPIEFVNRNNINDCYIGILTAYIPALYIFKVKSSNKEYNDKIYCSRKVGETQRNIEVRLTEWEDQLKEFANDKNLKIELISSYSLICDPSKDISIENPLISDKDIHSVLEKKFNRLSKNEAGSNEFFEFPSSSDEFVKLEVVNAMKNVFDNFLAEKKTRTKSGHVVESNFSFERTEDFKPRYYQKYVIGQASNIFKKFDEVLINQSARTGKTFESAMIVKTYTQKLGKTTFTIIVTGKTELCAEYKENWQSHKEFEDFSYVELNSDGTVNYWNGENVNCTAISFEAWIKDCKINHKNGVIYTSIQMLNENGSIKEKFNNILKYNFNFGIFDECHFGLQSESQWESCINTVNCTKRIYLSATPYRIIYNKKFDDKQIINFDISEYLKGNTFYSSGIDKIKEKEQISELKDTFPALYTVCPADTEYYFSLIQRIEKTKNEKDIEKVLKSILYDFKTSGLGCFDTAMIKNCLCKHIIGKVRTTELVQLYAKVAQHIINTDENLRNKFVVCSVTGNIDKAVDYRNYSDKTFEEYKNDIKELDEKGIRTITFTCDRFLTGTTVKQWDCFLILKNINSAETYEQETKRIYSSFAGKVNVVVWDFNIAAMTAVQAYKIGYIKSPIASQLNDIEKISNFTELCEGVINNFNIIQCNDDRNYKKVEPADIQEMLKHNINAINSSLSDSFNYVPISDSIDDLFNKDYNINKGQENPDLTENRYKEQQKELNKNKDKDKDTKKSNNKNKDKKEQTINYLKRNRDAFVAILCTRRLVDCTNFTTEYFYNMIVNDNDRTTYFNCTKSILKNILKNSYEITNMNWFIHGLCERYNTNKKCLDYIEWFEKKYEEKQ